MIRLWRQFVKWMRSIALKLKDGKPVSWGLKFCELMAIIAKGLKQAEQAKPKKPEKPESKKPESKKPEPKIPDYDLIGPKRRWWWRR